MTNHPPPRWDLSNVYPGLDSPELAADLRLFPELLAEIEKDFQEQALPLQVDSDPARLAAVLGSLIEKTNQLVEVTATIGAYIHSFVSTDSFNKQALKLQSEFQLASVAIQEFNVKFELWLGRFAPVLPEALEHPGSAQAHAFYLHETAEQSKYRMSDAEESLAAELNLSGASAWAKLQGNVTSQLSVDFELDGKVQKLPMPALINLHGHPDEDVRQRAYQAELKAWEGVREPLAACMNGIKGTTNTLNRRRGRPDALHEPLEQTRIDQPTLDALLGAMADSFPIFRSYYRAKAARLGKEQLAWWDIFAPTTNNSRRYSFGEARHFILDHFAEFHPQLADLARRAFDGSWIDAEQRVGKRGGAFCMSVLRVGESRILCNFDGSLDQVFTIAHELGHAFHNDCMVRAGKTPLQRSSPMTLNETASIMCETIATNAALHHAADQQEELNILETSLIGSSQVIVDIYSRFLFEKEVFERRAKSELSADDFCDIMARAQKATYGDALDERYLHPYMWTWKPHYYSAGRSFYNFPYAFGLLFGLGLYAIYQQRGDSFTPDYISLLSSTGESRAAELAARFGIDIRQKGFWAGSLGIIAKQIEHYTNIP